MENVYAKELSAKLKGLDYKQGLKLLKEINDNIECKSTQWKIGYADKPVLIYEVTLCGEEIEDYYTVLEDNEIYMIIYRVRIENADIQEIEQFLELCHKRYQVDANVFGLKANEEWMHRDGSAFKDIKKHFPKAEIEWDVVLPDLETNNQNYTFYRDGSELMEYGFLRKALPLSRENAKTDLEAVKKVVIDKFVCEKPIFSKINGLFCAIHPIFHSALPDVGRGHVSVGVVTDPKTLKKWMEQEGKYIRGEIHDLYTLIEIIRPEYRIACYKSIRQYLSDQDQGALLKHILKECDVVTNINIPDVTADEVADWFKKADRYALMNEKERKELCELPEKVTIYRGCNSVGLRGVCWTLGFKIADHYSFEYNFSKGHVYQMEIDKKDILAYFDFTLNNTVVIDPAIIDQNKPVKVEKNDIN